MLAADCPVKMTVALSSVSNSTQCKISLPLKNTTSRATVRLNSQSIVYLLTQNQGSFSHTDGNYRELVEFLSRLTLFSWCPVLVELRLFVS